MAGLAQAARTTGHPDGLGAFKVLSGAFQRGDVSADDYLAQFRALFGEVAARSLFPELVLLLPDASKRDALSAALARHLATLASGAAGVGVFKKPSVWGGRA